MAGLNERWALFLVPAPGSPLWRRAAAWLGHDPCAGAMAQAIPPAGMGAERFRTITALPRRYGFHGTLKPPFALVEGCNESLLQAAIAELAGGTAAFDLPPLRVGSLGGFVALLPTAPCAELDALAKRCVAELDGFRAPPGEAELARRRAGGLDSEEEALLRRWGYPYVMQRFRFHMTLSGRLTEAERAAVMAAAGAHFAEALAEPLRCDALSLFHQPVQGGDFVLRRRFPLAETSP